MRYRIVTDGGRGRIILDDIDMLIRHVRARGWHLNGIYENRATRPELQGHPLVRELNGPTWWEEGDCVMYEERRCDQEGSAPTLAWLPAARRADAEDRVRGAAGQIDGNKATASAAYRLSWAA